MDWTSAIPLSRITPAMAPATALGRDRVETFSTSAVWRSIVVSELPTARAKGVDTGILDVMDSSSDRGSTWSEAERLISWSWLSLIGEFLSVSVRSQQHG